MLAVRAWDRQEAREGSTASGSLDGGWVVGGAASAGQMAQALDNRWGEEYAGTRRTSRKYCGCEGVQDEGEG